MRSVLALGILIVLCVSANAATERHPRTRQPAARPRPPADTISTPSGATATPRFAVPGWSDEATRKWMDESTHYGEGD
ncbi:hypothetical protein JQ615_19520 [Bradyrhizobium jicamae]|uniref:Uncharacterized protein n=1 Tax=Bradyrhizobium jicamae TaxID=280332 RepID=A0ABS5FMM6_9BRAD|nr:hypothetical protein [Bradyrhizobium jicamae]MBR0797581.1 hypothetical protein [Bradyrhizobium jicamae]MBR0937245.1 hypothetical protein [Bradyrhizobium jicamae]